jgi:uncharacterized membrane protein YoaK (UPF0700 family)
MPSPRASPSTTAIERRAAQSLSAALLLTFTGGFLDAFLYIRCDRVFAGAMTGNAVLAGIALLTRDTHQVLHHLLPIAGFMVGLWCAFVLETRLHHHLVLVALSLEAAGLLIASCLPHGFPHAIFVPLICILAGYQVGSFRKVDSFVYNATFIAGNLLRAVESLHEALLRVRLRHSLLEARDLGLVLLVFVAGALAAALSATSMGNHALRIPLVAVLIVLAATLRRDVRYARALRKKVGEPI